jgi:TatD DNase family protein
MILVDTHTHIFGEQFQSDLAAVVERAIKTGVRWMLLPNIESSTIGMVTDACIQHPQLKPMWGLHPCHVMANWKEELDAIYPMFDKYPACAVGEIGLDFYWSKDFVEEQKQALTIQLSWALEKSIPVSLHTREATREAIDLVKPFADKGVRGVFHCFSGSEVEALEITDMGFFLGVGGSITYKKNTLRDFISQIPVQHLVLETDAPYLPPVPYRGKRNEPAYLQEVVYGLSDLYEISPARIAEITTANAVSLFDLESH